MPDLWKRYRRVLTGASPRPEPAALRIPAGLAAEANATIRDLTARAERAEALAAGLSGRLADRAAAIAAARQRIDEQAGELVRQAGEIAYLREAAVACEAAVSSQAPCTSCARILDSATAAEDRAVRAEAQLAVLAAVVERMADPAETIPPAKRRRIAAEALAARDAGEVPAGAEDGAEDAAGGFLA